MTIRPISRETDYNEALGEIDRLMGADPGTGLSFTRSVFP